MILTVFALAGNQPGVAAGEGVSLAATGQWPAFLVGPPLIGAVADLIGLRGALLIVVASLGIMVAVRRVVTPSAAVVR